MTPGSTKATTSLALVSRSYNANFHNNRICSQGTRAASIWSTQSGFTSFEKQYLIQYLTIFNGLDGLKGPLLVYNYHINNERHMHHGFLAPQAYLCSRVLNPSRTVKPFPDILIFYCGKGIGNFGRLCNFVANR